MKKKIGREGDRKKGKGNDEGEEEEKLINGKRKRRRGR